MRPGFKALLLSSSALVFAGTLAEKAHSVEWDVKVGGYMEQFVAYAGLSGPAGTDFDGINAAPPDFEFHVQPSITLDNGIKFSARIELEGFQPGNTIDANPSLIISGSFGTVRIGDENSAGYRLSYGAPDATFLAVDGTELGGFVPWEGASGGIRFGDDVFFGTLGGTWIENNTATPQARIAYDSPTFAGFSFAASFADDRGDSYWDVALRYAGEFGQYRVAASARYGFGNTIVGDSPTVIGFGGTVSYDIGQPAPAQAGVIPAEFRPGQFTIGGSFAEQTGTFGGARDGTSFDIGASYATGPWTFSLTYLHGENRDNEHAGGLGTGESVDQFRFGVDYKLAKGVRLNAYGAYFSFDETRSDAGGVTTGDDVSGFVIGTGIRVDF